MDHKMVATSVIPKVKLLTCVSLCGKARQPRLFCHAHRAPRQLAVLQHVCVTVTENDGARVFFFFFFAAE